MDYHGILDIYETGVKLLILKETEIRISELAELNIQDFDLRNQRFYVYRTKQRSTWITMSEALTDLIK